MRYDIKIFWVEDTPSWGKTAQEVLTLNLEAEGIYVDFYLEKDAKKASDLLKNSCLGFKKFDVLFIDFNISSNDYDGAKLIQTLRTNNIDVDVLFYSADKEREIRGIMTENLSAFEGVYIANRDTFKDKALSLIEKNTRRQRSIKNIRGILMDNTSENDFIVRSYILEKYRELSDSQKGQLNEVIVKFLNEEILPISSAIQKFVADVSCNGVKKIGDFIGKPSYLVPLELKYIIFKKMSEILNITDFDVDTYNSNVVSKRNILAHKKLEICEDLSRIKYCDTLKQYKNRQCQTSCSVCKGEFSISVDEWNQIRKQTIEFSNILDNILDNL